MRTFAPNQHANHQRAPFGLRPDGGGARRSSRTLHRTVGNRGVERLMPCVLPAQTFVPDARGYYPQRAAIEANVADPISLVPDPISIVRIVAFRNSTEDAVAYRSDGHSEPVAVERNALAPGDYVLEYDPGAAYFYKGAQTFLFRRKEEYTWAPYVEVNVLAASDRFDQLEQFFRLPEHIQDALLAEGAASAPYDKIQEAIEAGRILENANVTVEELLARQFRDVERGEDLVQWAIAFIETRARQAQEAVANRERLHSLGASLDRLPAEDKAKLTRWLRLARTKRISGLPARRQVEDLLSRLKLPYKELLSAFEKELRAAAAYFFAQAEIGITRAELLNRQFLTDTLLEIERARARQRKAERDRQQATAAIDIPEPRSEIEEVSLLRRTGPALLAVQAAGQRVADAEAQKTALLSQLGVGEVPGFDLDELLNARNARHQQALFKAFVVNVRRRLGLARRKVESDVRDLYAADRLVSLAKIAAGIEEGSLLDELISFGVSAATAERRWWEELLDAVAAVLVFVPGRVGTALALAADFASTPGVLNQFFTEQLLHQAGLSSDAPSTAGLLFFLGGQVLNAADARQLVRDIPDVFPRIRRRSGPEAGAGTAQLGASAANTPTPQRPTTAGAQTQELSPGRPLRKGGGTAADDRQPTGRSPAKDQFSGDEIRRLSREDARKAERPHGEPTNERGARRASAATQRLHGTESAVEVHRFPDVTARGAQLKEARSQPERMNAGREFEPPRPEQAGSTSASRRRPTRTPAQPQAASPVLVETNFKLSGKTAGTGGIRQISGSRGKRGALAVQIEGILKPPLKRDATGTPNFNRKLPSGRTIGLPEYEIAHLWGPGFGDEAFDGLMYAPKEVNQAFQNHGVESRLRELQTLAAHQGATISVITRAEGHPLQAWKGHDLLSHASYRFEVRLARGETRIIGEVDIRVPGPSSAGGVIVEVTGGSAEVWSLR